MCFLVPKLRLANQKGKRKHEFPTKELGNDNVLDSRQENAGITHYLFCHNLSGHACPSDPVGHPKFS